MTIEAIDGMNRNIEWINLEQELCCQALYNAF